MNTSFLPRRRVATLATLIILALFAVVTFGTQPELISAAPTSLNLAFTGEAGGILNTGFTTILPGTAEQDTNLLLTPGGAGTLQIQSTSGDLHSSATQDNALAIQYNSVDSYTIAARLLPPLSFTTPYQSAGIFIGQSQAAYIRLTAGVGTSSSNSERILLEVLDNGKYRTNTLSLPAGTLAKVSSSLDLFLTVDHASGRLTALYRIDSDSSTAIVQASARNLPRWLRLQGGKTFIPVYSGVVTTNRGASSIPVVYDRFQLTSAVVAAVSGFKSVDKDGVSSDQQVNAGDKLTYTISVTNNGTASTLQVVDPLPTDTTYVAGSATASAGTVSFSGSQLTWSGSLATNATATIAFQVMVNTSQLHSSTIQNDATLTNATLGGQPTILSASTFVSGVRPDLSASDYAAAPTAVMANDTVRYTLTLVNSGTEAATGANAQLTIPAGTTLVPGTATASSGTIAQIGDHLNWSTNSDLASDGTVTISFQALVGSSFTNSDSLVSYATIGSNETLPITLNAQTSFSAPTPTATATPADTATPTATEMSTATETPVDTATPTVTSTPVDTTTPTAASTPVDTATPTATETPADTATPTATSAPTATSTSTAVPSGTATPTAQPYPLVPSNYRIYMPLIQR